MSRTKQDITYAVRLFARHKAGLGIAIANLALALGLSTAVLALANGWLFPAIGVREPETLRWVEVEHLGPIRSTGPLTGFRSGAALTFRDFEHLRGSLPGASTVALLPGRADVSVEAGGSSRTMAVAYVTGAFFEVCGGRALIGRLPRGTMGWDEAGAVVLSYDAWRRLFRFAPDILQRQIVINNRRYAILAVADGQFTGPMRTQPPAVWLPISDYAAADVRGEATPRVLVRLSEPAAEAAFRNSAGFVLQNSHPEWAAQTGQVRLRLESVRDQDLLAARLDRRPGAVMGAVRVLLLALVAVALVNFGGFLLAVAVRREGEIGVRLALGATRTTIAVQLLIESLLVGCAGMLAGWGVAQACIPVLVRVADVPVGVPIVADGRTLWSLLALAVLTAVGAGLLPIKFARRLNVTAVVMGQSGRTGLVQSQRLRALLLTVQVAISLIMLVLAALWSRGAVRARTADPGFAADRLLSMPGRTTGGDWDRARAAVYWSHAMESVRRVPGGTGAALARYVFGGSSSTADVAAGPGEKHESSLNYVSPEYFEVVQTPVLMGRSFTPSETRDAAPVAVISAALARRFWPEGTAAIGSSLSLSLADSTRSEVTVIGIAADAMSTSLMELSRPVGTIYLPLSPERLPDAVLLVAVKGPAKNRLPEVERALPPSPDGRPPRLTSLATVVEYQRALAQVPSRLATLAAIALVPLTTIGLHSFVALIVHQRIGEVAIRMALGASPGQVAWFVARFLAGPVAVGIALGTLGATYAVKSFAGLLFGVSSADAAFVVIVIPIMLAALVAGAGASVLVALRTAPATTLKTA